MNGVKSCWSLGWGDKRAGEGIKADRRLRGIRYVKINLGFSLSLCVSREYDNKNGEVEQNGREKMRVRGGRGRKKERRGHTLDSE
jgi:hypothetical protein